VLADAFSISKIIPIKGTTYSQLGNKMFPAWEPNIPILGIYFELYDLFRR
jgi:hypothetical protein